MSALNSKIPSSRIPLHALEAQETARQAKLLRNTDAHNNIPQSLMDDYLMNLSIAENILAPAGMSNAEAMDCGKMLSELSPLSLNDNSSETTSEMGDNLLSQLLGVPSGNNIFNDIMPVNSLETAPPILKSNEIDVITDVINSLTDVISKYLPENNNVAPVANNGAVDNEVVTTPAEDIYQVILNDGLADLMLNGKEITQDGVYAADTIEKKDDTLILHQEDYDIIFKTDDAVETTNVADAIIDATTATATTTDATTVVADTTIDTTTDVTTVVADTTTDATTVVADSIIDATTATATTTDATTVVADTTIDTTTDATTVVADAIIDATTATATTTDATTVVADTTTDATIVANSTVTDATNVETILTADSTAKIATATSTTPNTLINLDGEVVKIEPFINSVFA